MDKLKNVLIGVGAVVVVVFIVLLIMGVRIAGTVFVWILGALVVLFIIGWIVYMVGKYNGRRSAGNNNPTEE